MDTLSSEEIKEYLALLKDKSVLYIEDDKVTREAFADIIGRYFKTVYVAINGKDGLEKYRDLLPSVVITDVEMPVMGAIEMIEKIREIDKNIPIMTISAFEDKKYISESATIVLQKPLRSENIRLSLALLSKSLKNLQHGE